MCALISRPTYCTFREYFSSLSLYSVWNMMLNIYVDATQGDDTATELCFGTFTPDTGVRLMTHDDITTPSGHGRVEVRMNGAWSSVCDDGFDERAAATLCSHLGFTGGKVTSLIIQLST